MRAGPRLAFANGSTQNRGMTRDDSQGHPQVSASEGFASTQWSLVLAARARDDDASEHALQQLCLAYWPPLFAYARRRVTNLHEAQDLTQAFFERLLEKHYLADADPQRGRFRAFLITAFRNFLSKERDRAQAQKRGAGRTRLAIDFSAEAGRTLEPADALTAERIYEREWAITLLQRVMRRLQREMERDGRGLQFAVLKPFLAGAGSGEYGPAASRLRMTGPAVRMAVSRLRSRYRDLLREEIAHTVCSPDDVDDEVRHLFETFGG